MERLYCDTSSARLYLCIRAPCAGVAHSAQKHHRRHHRARTAAAAWQQQLQADDLEQIESSEGQDVLSFNEPDDLDPEGRAARLEDFYAPREGVPQALVDELYSDAVYGPPVSAPETPSKFRGLCRALDAAAACEY
jgi:hypothetical protein